MKTTPWYVFSLDFHEERFGLGRAVWLDGKWKPERYNRTYKSLRSAGKQANLLNKEKV